MPIRTRVQSIQPYSITVRALDGKKIFGTDEDASRLLVLLYMANWGRPALNLHRCDIRRVADQILQGDEAARHLVREARSPLVHLLSFALTPISYHLLLLPRTKTSVSAYIQKVNIGYAKYFNTKQGRRGPLFEGRFHQQGVEKSSDLMAQIREMNIRIPLEYFGSAMTQEEAVKFLHAYPYSSFHDLYRERTSLLVSAQEKQALRDTLGRSFPAHDYLELIEEEVPAK